MANEEHLAILKQALNAEDIEIWNTWIKAHPHIHIDLSGADLSNTNLSDANLSEASLEYANLNGANLEKAELTRAWLFNSKLQKANLTGVSMRAARFPFADLQEAILIGCDAGKAEFQGANMSYSDCSVAGFWETKLNNTDLSYANLQDANLRGAVMVHTKLHKTKFQRTSIGTTVFASVNLFDVIGIDEVEHWKPSHLDIDTLYQSKGKISKKFLQGCGIPDTMITFAESIVAASKPIEFYKVFFSFSGKDNEFAEKLFNVLNEQGVESWKYDRQQHLGSDVFDNIDVGLKSSDKVVFISSHNSWESNIVIDEIKHAKSQQDESGELILIPITIDNRLEKPDNFFMSIISRTIYAKFEGWEHDSAIFNRGVEQLIQALSKSQIEE